MKALLIRPVLVLAAMVAPQAASATRVVIDSIPGAPFMERFDGYCDYDGSNCTNMNTTGGGGSGYLLPFSVSFDGGNTYTSTMFVRGDGRLSFGGTGDYYSYIQGSYVPGSLNSGEVKYNAGTSPFATVQVGINDQRTPDQYSLLEPGAPEYAKPLIYSQSAAVTGDKASTVVHFFTCTTPPCEQSAYNRYDVTLSATTGGIQVDATYYNGFQRAFAGQSAGWTLASGASGSTAIAGSSLSFIVPVTFAGATPVVPEAATWMMMIAGFGLTGGMLRRSRRGDALACA